jgi:hypothetical protein
MGRLIAERVDRFQACPEQGMQKFDEFFFRFRPKQFRLRQKQVSRRAPQMRRDKTACKNAILEL